MTNVSLEDALDDDFFASEIAIEEDEECSVSDKREIPFFLVNHDIFDKSRKLSVHGIVVYFVLCKLANWRGDIMNLKRSYIAKIARISSGSVSKGVAELVSEGLISVEERRDGQTKLPTQYTLLNTGRSYSDGHTMTVMTRRMNKETSRNKETKKNSLSSRVSDERRGDLTDLLKYAWTQKNATPFVMDGKDGKAVSRFLETYKQLNISTTVADWFTNMIQSEDFNGSWRPFQYLDRLNSWANGIHDKYGRLKCN
jgi:hypothetical protein